jgi:hypothetical protein
MEQGEAAPHHTHVRTPRIFGVVGFDRSGPGRFPWRSSHHGEWLRPDTGVEPDSLNGIAH